MLEIVLKLVKTTHVTDFCLKWRRTSPTPPLWFKRLSTLEDKKWCGINNFFGFSFQNRPCWICFQSRNDTLYIYIYVDTSIDKDRALYISFYNLGILAETLPNLHGMYLEEVISSMELPRFTCFNPNLDSMTTSGYLSKLPFGRKSIMWQHSSLGLHPTFWYPPGSRTLKYSHQTGKTHNHLQKVPNRKGILASS